MTRRPRMGVGCALFGASIAVALLSDAAQAKPWKELAPSPLASDSTYAAFLAQPSDSLTAAQLSWLAVQRDWRLQREVEHTWSSSSSITVSRHGSEHYERRTDVRFAALASQPYAALPDTDRAWLVAENAAQRVARESPERSGELLAVAIVAAIGGAIAATLLLAYGFNHSNTTW
jgi:hypothetical protein